LDVEEGSALVGRAHTQMLAHREKRPEAVSYSGSGLFCVLQHPPSSRPTRIQPLLVDSIVNRVKWKETGVWGRYTELYFVWGCMFRSVAGRQRVSIDAGHYVKKPSHSKPNGSYAGDEWL